MKIRIKFSKQGHMKFIGHLDTMRYFQKVMRRANVDICYSEGFSPHQKMSFAAPLGVGIVSNGEYFDIEVSESSQAAAAASDFYDKYNNLPENIAKPQQQDKPLTVEEITAAVISAIKDNFTVEEQKTTPPDPKDDLEQRAAEILEDLDYI